MYEDFYSQMVNRRLKPGSNGVERFSYMEAGTFFPPTQCVVVHRDFDEQGWRDVTEWITMTPGLTGKFWSSPNHWEAGKRAAMFIFSDENTAIAFKLKWC